MPSNKPRLMTYTEKETIEKFEIIAKKENRSMSKQLEYIVKQYINNYESANGTITTNKTINMQDNNGTINMWLQSNTIASNEIR